LTNVRKEPGAVMKFLRIGDIVIRLDLIVRIKEGRSDETFYGRSVRKGAEGGWLEVHFTAGEALQLEGEAAAALRRYMEVENLIQDLGVYV
jgi:hypothetical protein